MRVNCNCNSKRGSQHFRTFWIAEKLSLTGRGKASISPSLTGMQGASLHSRAPRLSGARQNAQNPYLNRSSALGRPCSYSRRVQRSSRLTCRADAAAAETFPAQVCVVLGTQWGDEGKGKLVDILAQQYDVIARAQVS